MKRALTVMLLVALIVTMLMPTMAFAMSNPNSRFVKTGNGKPLNVRSGPGTNNEVFFKLPYGTQVEVIDTQGDWCLIRPYDKNLWSQAGNSTNMWVMKSFLVTKNPGPWKKPEPDTPTYEEVDAALRQLKLLESPVLAVIVTSRPTNYVHLRWVPSTNARFSAQYLAGEQVLVLAQSKTWSQVVDLTDGRVGFILTNNVNPLLELDEETMQAIHEIFESLDDTEAVGAAQ